MISGSGLQAVVGVDSPTSHPSQAITYYRGFIMKKNKSGYRAHINLGGHRASLGTYKTPEEASKVYRREKELRVRRVAEEYKDSLDPRVYKNLMEYKVPLEDIIK